MFPIHNKHIRKDLTFYIKDTAKARESTVINDREVESGAEDVPSREGAARGRIGKGVISGVWCRAG